MAICMYAMRTLSLITQLQDNVKQCWHADDSALGDDDILNLNWWWDLLLYLGSHYSYFLLMKLSLGCMVVKVDAVDTAMEVFRGSDIKTHDSEL